MISYETYKTLHLFFILTLFSSLGFSMATGSIFQKKYVKMILALVSFLIFVAGMGLVARLNFKHNEAFPLWVRTKVGIWLIINILFLLLIKIKNQTFKYFLFALILLAGGMAIWFAVNKPL